jgi:hypothetical protein
MPYDATSTGIRRTTIYTTPEDRTRLAELARQIAQMEPDAPQDCTTSEAIRGAVEYTLRYAFGVGEGQVNVNGSRSAG